MSSDAETDWEDDDFDNEGFYDEPNRDSPSRVTPIARHAITWPFQRADQLDIGGEGQHDWIAPGLIERGDRVIVTASEGAGKSTLLDQFAVQLASGIHPMRPTETIDPVLVVRLDFEARRGQLQRRIDRLRATAGSRFDPELLAFRSFPEGVNMLAERDGIIYDSEPSIDESLAQLAMTHDHEIDVILAGPYYKMFVGNALDDEVARQMSRRFDVWRERFGCALFLEMHNAYEQHGNRRPTRPFGPSLWSRWPEVGFHIGKGGVLTHWRGQREEREWPKALMRGGDWPWMPVESTRDNVWALIVDTVTAAGEPLSQRKIADRIGSNQAAVRRAINDHDDEWNALLAGLGAEA